MLVLKENVGKSVVLQSLIEANKDAYAIVYDKDMIGTLEALFSKREVINHRLSGGLALASLSLQ